MTTTANFHKMLTRANKAGYLLNAFQIKKKKWQANFRKVGDFSFKIGFGTTIEEAMLNVQDLNLKSILTPSKRKRLSKPVRKRLS